MLFIVANAACDVLEAALRDKGKPTGRITLTLQLVTLMISNQFALLFAELSQHLIVSLAWPLSQSMNTVISEFLFHRAKGITNLAIIKTLCQKIDYS
jgi:hypothetical protein